MHSNRKESCGGPVFRLQCFPHDPFVLLKFESFFSPLNCFRASKLEERRLSFRVRFRSLPEFQVNSGAVSPFWANFFLS